MKKLLCGGLLAVLVLGASVVQAQTSFGPRVGLNLANVHVDFKEDAPETKMLLGAQLGMALNVRFGNLAVQPAVLFSQKGYRLDFVSKHSATDTIFTKGPSSVRTSTTENPQKGSVRLNYVEIPVNLVYTLNGDHGFQVLIGPYVGFGLGGKVKLDAYTSKTTITTTELFIQDPHTSTVETTEQVEGVEQDVQFKGDVKEDDDFKKSYYSTPDFGLNVGVGYLMTNHWQIQAVYGWGLTNLLPRFAGEKPDDKMNNRVIQLTAGYWFGGE